MNCRSSFEKNILIFHLKRNAGWICPLTNSFQKKCATKFWAHKFVFDVDKTQNSGFLLHLKKKRLIDRIMKKKLKKKMKLNSSAGVIETKPIK